MPTIQPPARPRISRKELQQLLLEHEVSSPVGLVGIRGYYRDSMGEAGTNDRGIYDDCIALVSPDTTATWNANVDPSVHRPGIASLVPGVWRYQIGIHGLSRPKDQQYKALVQAAPVLVHRDRKGHDRGWFGINIHRGGKGGTSSLGCQTIPPDQWPAFIALVEQEMRRNGLSQIPYLLTVAAP
jgi:lysozyme